MPTIHIPNDIKKLHGTYRPSRENHFEPKQGLKLLSEDKSPPRHLNRAQKKVWQECIEMLPEGWLTHTDRFAVELLAILMEKFRRELTLANAERAQLTQLLIQLGMTPASRHKVVMQPVKPQEDDFSKFMQ
jgi:phage terminase small subunit